MIVEINQVLAMKQDCINTNYGCQVEIAIVTTEEGNLEATIPGIPVENNNNTVLGIFLK
jgi:hypothetical protein